MEEFRLYEEPDVVLFPEYGEELLDMLDDGLDMLEDGRLELTLLEDTSLVALATPVGLETELAVPLDTAFVLAADDFLAADAVAAADDEELRDMLPEREPENPKLLREP